MRISEAKKIENENFREAIKTWPRFFESQTFIDNQKFLAKYGIFIPEKKKLPLGYLKLWPQDFIVEEIGIDGELQTVFPDKFMHKKRDYLPEDPIIFATLVKCGLSTIEVMEELARSLDLKPEKKTSAVFQGISPAAQNIKFAGIKDKHAITSQLISITRAAAKGEDEGKPWKGQTSSTSEGEIDETTPHLPERSEGREMNKVQRTSPRSAPPRSVIEKLHQVSSPNFFIKNVFSGRREIYLGGLKANQFTILIRTGPDFKKEEFLKRLAEIEKNGFYNFFYLQRFGTPRLLNHYCGLHILKGKYEKAIFTAFCRPGERELFYFQSLRKEIEKLWGKWKEIQEVLEFFPLTFQDERIMIDHLVQNPNDFAGALNQIPRVVQLWLNSFSALLFNKLLSFYLQKKKKPPATLTLVLDQSEKSWLAYKEWLKQEGIYSMTFALKNLQPFPYIVVRKREQKTIERVKILAQKIIPEGVILNFVLPKGCYATTFLSHLFNLASGNLPKRFSNLPIDTKANLNQPSLEEILNKFTDVVSSPSWRYLWRIY